MADLHWSLYSGHCRYLLCIFQTQHLPLFTQFSRFPLTVVKMHAIRICTCYLQQAPLVCPIHFTPSTGVLYEISSGIFTTTSNHVMWLNGGSDSAESSLLCMGDSEDPWLEVLSVQPNPKVECSRECQWWRDMIWRIHHTQDMQCPGQCKLRVTMRYIFALIVATTTDSTRFRDDSFGITHACKSLEVAGFISEPRKPLFWDLMMTQDQKNWSRVHTRFMFTFGCIKWSSRESVHDTGSVIAISEEICRGSPKPRLIKPPPPPSTPWRDAFLPRFPSSDHLFKDPCSPWFEKKSAGHGAWPSNTMCPYNRNTGLVLGWRPCAQERDRIDLGQWMAIAQTGHAPLWIGEDSLALTVLSCAAIQGAMCTLMG